MEQPIHLAGARLERHRHLCAFFEGLDEEYAVLIPVIQEGLQRREKVVLVVAPPTRPNHLERLRRAGIDVRHFEQSGQLEVRSWNEIYLVGGRFKMSRMLGFLDRQLTGARSHGFPRTRFIAHMEWALEDHPGVDDLLEYEARLTRMLMHGRDVVICIYDASKFGGRQVVDIIRTHPMNIVGGVLQDDPFFSRPDVLIRELRNHHEESRHSASSHQRSAQRHKSLRPKSVRSAIRDLVGVLLVPTTWRNHASSFIVDGLLELMSALVPLDIAFVSLNDESHGSKKYFCKTRPGKRCISAKELALLVDGQDSQLEPFSIPNPLGKGTLTLLNWPLGVDGRWGMVAAASSTGFRSTDVFMLRAASTQAVLALDAARSHALEAEKSKLEGERFRAATELAQLRAHVQPHFLLNTLSAIAGLVSTNPSEARQVLVALGDLLRDLLKDTREMQTLEAQIEWLHRYAEILQIRHAGRLAFRWQIGAEAKPVLLPPLLLQPLLENAIGHGALRRKRGGEVMVRARVVQVEGEPKLVCSIEDNGPGFEPGRTRPGAQGLSSVERYLAYKYGDKAKLRFKSSSSGTKAIVELPLVVGSEVRRAS